ncbi:hypothetical protein CL614_00985 [archaeon]|nr:hypothetical protein [archaeon]|tara:strand:- start:3032 stop:3838 length:807 start_codon:yes stop_codon:yes gene_type:complete
MPTNAPPEYYKAVGKFKAARDIEEKLLAAHEVFSNIPDHKGCETLKAEWNSKISKLKKEQVKSKKKGMRQKGIKKEGYAQVCILGLPNSGKSLLLSKITDAKPEIEDYEYTTTTPIVGMMDYNGIKIQLIEIPATMSAKNMSLVRSSDAVVSMIRFVGDDAEMKEIVKNNFIKKPHIFLRSDDDKAKEKIWKMLGLIIVYTVLRDKKGKRTSPMALKKDSDVKHFCENIHKDFVKDFRFARLKRGKRIMQVGSDYKLKQGDIVEIFTT